MLNSHTVLERSCRLSLTLYEKISTEVMGLAQSYTDSEVASQRSCVHPVISLFARLFISQTLSGHYVLAAALGPKNTEESESGGQRCMQAWSSGQLSTLQVYIWNLSVFR